LGCAEAVRKLTGLVLAAQTKVGLHQQRSYTERLQIAPDTVEPDQLVFQHVDDLGQVTAAERAEGGSLREVRRHRVEAVDGDVDSGPVEQPSGVVMHASEGALGRSDFVRTTRIRRNVEGPQQLNRLTCERMGAHVVAQPGQAG